MEKIEKTLCELKRKDFVILEKEIIKSVKKGKYICKKCIRVSNSKDLLCKPKKM